MQRLKRAVIKEELVAITGDYKLAIVLNQLLYWNERVGISRYNKFMEEENNRLTKETENLEGGWVYKKAEELSEEIMINASVSTIRRYIKKLVDMGYILERTNPKVKFDKTKQYRINLLKIILDLDREGYHLQNYKNTDKLLRKLKNDRQPLKRSSFQNETPGFYNETPGFYNETPGFYNETAIPESTTKSTTKSTTEKREILNLIKDTRENLKIK